MKRHDLIALALFLIFVLGMLLIVLTVFDVFPGVFP